MNMRKSAVVAMVLAVAVCSGCGEDAVSDTQSTVDDTAVSQDIFAMDTYMTVTAYGEGAEAAVDAAVAYIEELDDLLSIGSDNSEITQLNETGSGTLSDDPAEILSRAIEIAEMTDGAFNPAMYPLMEAWGFPSQEYRVPSQSELDALLPLIDLSGLMLDLDSGNVTLSEGMKLDLGGIAKGYTSAQVMEIFVENGVTSGLVSLGGNVQTLGTKTDGSLWRIALQNPDESADYLGVLELSDKAVITSGGYERYFEQDGITYHHILDPETGYPAESGLQSVTIVSDDGTLADALSTALFVMGLDKAIEFWRTYSDQFDAVFLTDDAMIYVTEGIADSFSSTSYSWEIIEEAG